MRTPRRPHPSRSGTLFRLSHNLHSCVPLMPPRRWGGGTSAGLPPRGAATWQTALQQGLGAGPRAVYGGMWTGDAPLGFWFRLGTIACQLSLAGWYCRCQSRYARPRYQPNRCGQHSCAESRPSIIGATAGAEMRLALKIWDIVQHFSAASVQGLQHCSNGADGHATLCLPPAFLASRSSTRHIQHRPVSLSSFCDASHRGTMSASGDWGPAPPGIDLSEHQSGSIISTVTAVMTLAVVAVVLRLVARFKARNVLAADDYLIFLALVSSRFHNE